MIERILGLDIGISSVGWAVIEYNKENSLNNKIIKTGVRIFTIAENPKTGESLALPRRLARGARRTLKRKRQRMKAIKTLFISYLGLSKIEIFSDNNIYGEKKRIDIWQLRSEALQRKLNNKEFARVLTHIAKRRGYKSNRKVEEKGDSEGKKVLGAIEENKKLLSQYKTIGEAIYKTTQATQIRRNKKDDYKYSVSRDMLLDEINTIFQKQKEVNNTVASDEFKEKYVELFLKQKDFASVDNMVGTCSLEGKKEKRAPKRSYSAEEFVTLSKLINTKIVDKYGFERSFTTKELKKAIDLCKQSEKPTYIKLKDTIGLGEESCFKGIDFHVIDKKTGEVTKKTTQFISAFKGFHELRKVVEKSLSKIYWQNLSQDIKLLDEIAKIFSYHKSDTKIEEELQKLEFSSLIESEKAKLIASLIANIHFEYFLQISLKAIHKIIPLMKEGKRYDEAVSKLGYKSNAGKKEKFLRALNKEEIQEITNPVVKRAIAQTRKVINALIRTYGQFDKVHIELTREIKKSHSDRKKVQKLQEEYQNIKKSIVEKFQEDYGREPRGKELLKFRLLREQDYRCIYSGKDIKPEKLLEQGYVEVDHVLPFSRSLEDGMQNKVLCLAKENQDKKNRTPFEYFNEIGRDWHWFEEFIKGLKNIKKAKRERLLKKNFDESSQNEFRERNINDTAYMARFLKNFIENNLELKSRSKKKVITINGMLTNMLRHNWGIGDKSRDNHLHHAVDATIIAFATDSEVQLLSTVSAKNEQFIYEKEKSKKVRFYPPMQNFRDEVEASISDIFVSFAPRRGVSGAAHKETIHSKKDEKPKGSFKVNGGLAENGEVKRIDIFKKNGKYHFIYLYPADFEKSTLPAKTIKGLHVDESFEFIFSLFKDEFIEIKQKNKEQIKGYLKFSLSDGRFAIANHLDANFNATKNRFSTGSLEYIKKYQICPLGTISEIKSEKRAGTKRMK